jgi:hypothetical protein
VGGGADGGVDRDPALADLEAFFAQLKRARDGWLTAAPAP